ncbi:MAG: D-aminoacyl-tRNA deacylase [Paracoccus sp. (in: a-proteobacteria)]|nr:D-aminoacyl-tRNA deacylase [Paracoccus sp. (in: a-proteobacteria)]
MRALVQRAARGKVSVGAETVGEIGPGLVVLVCAMAGDSEAEAVSLARRVAKLRIFRDDEGRMNRSVQDSGGEALVISQFTLAADTRSGNRPGFSSAAPPEIAEALYLRFADALRSEGITVATGRFGADMAVELINDGPVTIWLDTADRR